MRETDREICVAVTIANMLLLTFWPLETKFLEKDLMWLEVAGLALYLNLRSTNAQSRLRLLWRYLHPSVKTKPLQRVQKGRG